MRIAAEIKKTAADKTKHTDWYARNGIKAELNMDFILGLAEYSYPPITNDEIFREILKQEENFKKYDG